MSKVFHCIWDNKLVIKFTEGGSICPSRSTHYGVRQQFCAFCAPSKPEELHKHITVCLKDMIAIPGG